MNSTFGGIDCNIMTKLGDEQGGEEVFEEPSLSMTVQHPSTKISEESKAEDWDISIISSGKRQPEEIVSLRCRREEEEEKGG